MMHCKRKLLLLLIPWHLLANQSFGNENLRGIELFESYCFDCHDEDVQKGNATWPSCLTPALLTEP